MAELKQASYTILEKMGSLFNFKPATKIAACLPNSNRDASTYALFNF